MARTRSLWLPDLAEKDNTRPAALTVQALAGAQRREYATSVAAKS